MLLSRLWCHHAWCNTDIGVLDYRYRSPLRGGTGIWGPRPPSQYRRRRCYLIPTSTGRCSSIHTSKGIRGGHARLHHSTNVLLCARGPKPVQGQGQEETQ